MAGTVRQRSLTESIRVPGAGPGELYGLVAEVRNMGRWSPECRGVWAPGAALRAGSRFIGFNRRGPFVWFTTCRVVEAVPGEAFVFDAGVFGLPIARWGYRFEAYGAEGADKTDGTGEAGAADVSSGSKGDGTDGDGPDGNGPDDTAARPGTRVTETWQDLRTGRGAGFAVVLGRVFTGVSPERRIGVNRAGMRTTLARLAREAARPA
ncbi:SRPBCC family protein [Streptomyces sp. NPDC048717]|uniref:SRPBCC family protein n=1 Tax=Streptomyces sp. NPDC048717 TaxID=3154928 RepID=UPI003443F5A5